MPADAEGDPRPDPRPPRTGDGVLAGRRTRVAFPQARVYRLPLWSWAGWVLAAACLVLLLRDRRPLEPTGAGEQSPAIYAFENLDAGHPDVTGRVVWDASEGRGHMVFENMPVNDPDAEQYQLWIFDRNQQDEYPIDGGVFDIGNTGEVRVPIDPKLGVRDAWMFAVTVEKPGGVVVSSRERLVLLAKV